MAATCHTRTVGRYCELLGPEIARFGASLAAADPAARVPTCPDWTVADLAGHGGGVHRWAGELVRRRAPDRVPWKEMGFTVPPEPDRAAWVSEGGPALLEILRAADPDAAMWSWGADRHARFWPRRMLHETTVHRADAEITLGRDPSVADEVAIDGIDEFLDNAPHARSFAPNVANLTGDGERIALRAGGVDWLIRLEADGFRWEHPAGDGSEATVDGDPAALYLLLWGRRSLDDDAIRVSGDRALLDRWVENSKL